MWVNFAALLGLAPSTSPQRASTVLHSFIHADTQTAEHCSDALATLPWSSLRPWPRDQVDGCAPQPTSRSGCPGCMPTSDRQQPSKQAGSRPRTRAEDGEAGEQRQPLIPARARGRQVASAGSSGVTATGSTTIMPCSPGTALSACALAHAYVHNKCSQPRDIRCPSGRKLLSAGGCAVCSSDCRPGLKAA